MSLSQYATFLNAVAATDTYSLYNANMATFLNTAGISRTGGSGSYSYALVGSGSRPVSYVSWFDAARFANWMQNGATAGSSTFATPGRDIHVHVHVFKRNKARVIEGSREVQLFVCGSGVFRGVR